MDETQIAKQPELEVMAAEPGSACSSCCKNSLSTLVRAIIYIPVFLLISGMSAIAMYPELAEYAAPLLPAQTHSCGSATMRANGTACCATSGEDLMAKDETPPGEMSAESEVIASSDSAVSIEATSTKQPALEESASPLAKEDE